MILPKLYPTDQDKCNEEVITSSILLLHNIKVQAYTKQCIECDNNMASEKLSFADLKNSIRQHLKMALNVEDFSINSAKQDGDIWKVIVEFKEKTGAIEMPTTALFIIDVTTGEVKEFKKGYMSTF